MVCPCCGPVWVCQECCCPDGSQPPATIKLKFENYQLCSPSHIVTPVDFHLFSDLSVEDTYTLKQDTYGPFRIISPNGGFLIAGAVANNCLNYTYSDGTKVVLSAGRWPPGAGTFYGVTFSGTGMDGVPTMITGVFNGGYLYDICVGNTRQPDISMRFKINKNGVPQRQLSGGRLFDIEACVDCTISR